MTFIVHPTKRQQDTHSFQVHMERSPRQTLPQGHKTNLTNLKRTKIRQNIFSNMMELHRHQ